MTSDANHVGANHIKLFLLPSHTQKKTLRKLNYMKQLFLDIGQWTVIPERRKINEVKSVTALGFCLEALSGLRSEKEKPLKSTVVSVS